MIGVAIQDRHAETGIPPKQIKNSQKSKYSVKISYTKIRQRAKSRVGE